MWFCKLMSIENEHYLLLISHSRNRNCLFRWVSVWPHKIIVDTNQPMEQLRFQSSVGEEPCTQENLLKN